MLAKVIQYWLAFLCELLEVLFVFIKSNENIKGIEIFKQVFLYTAYADDSTFYLRDISSVTQLINSFSQFYHFSGLKVNIEKCEITGIDSLKGVTQADCGLKVVDLSIDTSKILGIHFSYNKKVQMQNDFITMIRKYSTFFVCGIHVRLP